jgi:hypothetical protein
MNAHRVNLSSAPALIDAASSTLGRILRLAPHATPNARLHVMGELTLTDRVLDQVEHEVTLTAQAALKAVPKQRALPPGKVAV